MITKSGSIYSVPLTQTIPPALERDRRMVSVVAALADILQTQAVTIYETDGIYFRLGALNEKMLDILATDLHADWYDYGGPLEEKRRLILNDVAIHRGMGTVAMLRRVLESIHGECAIEEWFQYGGEPHYFRVAMDITEPNEEINHPRIVDAVMVYKPVRSHLEEDSVAYRSRNFISAKMKAGYVVYSVRKVGTYPTDATIGSIAGADIIAGNEMEYGIIDAPKAGDVETGTYPIDATIGATVGANIRAVNTVDAGIVDAPKSGSLPAGVYPNETTAGAHETSAINAADQAAVVQYEAPKCGAKL